MYRFWDRWIAGGTLPHLFHLDLDSGEVRLDCAPAGATVDLEVSAEGFARQQVRAVRLTRPDQVVPPLESAGKASATGCGHRCDHRHYGLEPQ